MAVCKTSIVIPLLGSLLAIAPQMDGWQNRNGANIVTAPDHYSRISESVRRAKAAGLQEVTLPAPRPVPTAVKGLSDVIETYSLLRVTVLDSATVVDEQSIETWYKVKIVETFVGQANIPGGAPPPNTPARFLPIGQSEAIDIRLGGSAVIDGITVNQLPSEASDLGLRVGDEYIGGFFVEWGGKRITSLAPPFEVRGDVLTPLGVEDSPLVRDFHDFASNRLSELRRYLGTPAPVQK